MAKTSIKLFIAINPYKAKGQDDEFNVLRVDAEYWRGKGFRVSYQPSWYKGGVWGCIMDFSNDPLVAGGTVDVLSANRNDQKKLQAIHDNLNTKNAREIISYLFNMRDIGAMETAMKYIALNPEWATDEEVAEIKSSYPSNDNANNAKSDDNKDNENNINNNNSNSETMANVSKGADNMVGRVLILGENIAKYTILSVSADGYYCQYEKEGMPPIALPLMSKATFEGLVANPNTHWADEAKTTATTETTPTTDNAKANEPIAEPKPTAKPKATAKTSPAIESDVEEVNDNDVDAGLGAPVKAHIVEPTAATEDNEPTEPKATATTATTSKARTVKINTNAKTTAKGGKVTFAAYTTKRGKTGGQIMGFTEDSDIYQAGYELHASKTWVRKNGKKIFTLLFGPRYKDAAEAMAKAINEGASLDECREIIEGNTEALAKRRAEQKAEYLQKKAERANGTVNTTNANGEKLYTESEVKERIRKALYALVALTKEDPKKFEPIVEPIIKAA